MKGILLAGGKGTRLYPLTLNTSKQLLPIYDKPMIYYPISTLMHMGIRDIALICDPSSLSDFKRLLGTGEQWGVNIKFFIQESPEGIAQAYLLTKDFARDSSLCLILGDNLFVWPGLKPQANMATESNGARIFAYEVSNPGAYGNISINTAGKVTALVEKPEVPISNFAVPGIYLTDQTAPERAKSLKKSKRGEYEIVDLLKSYMTDGELYANLLPRGTAWFDTGSMNDLYNAAEYIKIIQERQGQLVGSPEEVAIRNGWKSREAILQSLPKNSQSQYYAKLKTTLESGDFKGIGY